MSFRHLVNQFGVPLNDLGVYQTDSTGPGMQLVVPSGLSGKGWVQIFNANTAAAASHDNKLVSGLEGWGTSGPARGEALTISESSNAIGGIYKIKPEQTRLLIGLISVDSGTYDIEFCGVDSDGNLSVLIVKARFTAGTLNPPTSTTNPFINKAVGETLLYPDEMDTSTNGENRITTDWDKYTTWNADNKLNMFIIKMDAWEYLLPIITNLTATSRVICCINGHVA